MSEAREHYLSNQSVEALRAELQLTLEEAEINAARAKKCGPGASGDLYRQFEADDRAFAAAIQAEIASREAGK